MTFSIVTWNILADAYVQPERYPLSPPEALDPARRRRLLLDTIGQAGADVYCLQEVEQPAFDAIAARLGPYDGHLALKRGKPDGCAIFVRRAALLTVETEILRFDAVERGYNQLALLARLRQGRSEVVVASTHLPWQKASVSPVAHLGRRQMIELLDRLPRFAPGVSAHVVTGDLNSLSEGPPVHAALDRGLRLSCRSQRPWDTVSIGGRCRKLDYLLYTPATLSPRPGTLPRLRSDTAMPSAIYASDHLPVCVEFSLT